MKIQVFVNQKEAFRRGCGSSRIMILDLSDDEISRLSDDDRSLIARNLNVLEDGEWDAVVEEDIPSPTLAGIVEALKNKEIECLAEEAQALEWVHAHGSDELKRWVAAEVPGWKPGYELERLTLERPGWGWPEWGYPEPYDSVGEALDDLPDARKTSPNAIVEHNSVDNKGGTETYIVAEFMGDQIYYLEGRPNKESAGKSKKQK